MAKLRVPSSANSLMEDKVAAMSRTNENMNTERHGFERDTGFWFYVRIRDPFVSDSDSLDQ